MVRKPVIDLETLRKSKVEMFESRPLTTSPMSSLSEIIGILEKNDAHEVFIENGDKVGVVSIRDVLKASDILGMRASSLMTIVHKLSPSDSVERAAAFMSDYRLRTLPVGEKRVDGAVTVQSLCQALLSIKEFGGIKIDKLMKKDPITIGKSESASKARSVMVEHSIDHLPVLDSGRVRGILLSNQVVLSMFPKEKLEQGMLSGEAKEYSSIKVSELMDTNILVCGPDERASDVLKRMIEQDKTYALMKQWDELQGIATYRDFVTLLIEPEKPDFPAYIVGLPDDPFEAHLAQVKFFKEAKALRRSFPDMEEIRATIKTKSVPSGRHRYEISVSIEARGKIHAYSAEGWDLPAAFEGLQSKMKRILTQRPDKRERGSTRKSFLAK
jgi:CBS domain-containing protein/ribosome-associated translation inhibitor RaiA